MRTQVAILLAMIVTTCAACGGGAAKPSTTTVASVATSSGSQAPSTTTTSTPDASTASSAAGVLVGPDDGPACAVLYARLQVVSNAISASSELIAHSINKKQLSGRIAVEREQLLRSAQVLTGGPVPTALIGADRRLIAALIQFSDDFARAAGPARRGDFKTATADMADQPAVQRILAAATTIQNACQAAGVEPSGSG